MSSSVNSVPGKLPGGKESKDILPFVGFYQLESASAGFQTVAANAFLTINVLENFTKDAVFTRQPYTTTVALTVDGQKVWQTNWMFSFEKASDTSGTLTLQDSPVFVPGGGKVTFTLNSPLEISNGIGQCSGVIGGVEVKGVNRFGPIPQSRFVGVYKSNDLKALPQFVLTVKPKGAHLTSSGGPKLELTPYLYSPGMFTYIAKAIPDPSGAPVAYSVMYYFGTGGASGRAASSNIQVNGGPQSSQMLFEFPPKQPAVVLIPPQQEKVAGDEEAKQEDAMFQDIESYLYSDIAQFDDLQSQAQSVSDKAATLFAGDKDVKDKNAINDALRAAVVTNKADTPKTIASFGGYYQVLDEAGIPTGEFLAVTPVDTYVLLFGRISTSVILAYWGGKETDLPCKTKMQSEWFVSANAKDGALRGSLSIPKNTVGFPECSLQFNYRCVGGVVSEVKGSIGDNAKFSANSCLLSVPLEAFIGKYKQQSNGPDLLEVSKTSSGALQVSQAESDGAAPQPLLYFVYVPAMYAVLSNFGKYGTCLFGTAVERGLACSMQQKGVPAISVSAFPGIKQ